MILIIEGCGVKRRNKPLVIMKFGGSSMADVDRIKRVAGLVIDRKKKGNNVVVVVSAPGDTTDELIERAHSITRMPDEREMDVLLSTGEQVSIALLAIAIKSRKYLAVSLTGPQAGIYSDGSHTRARVTAVRPHKIMSALKQGNIVIVAGFQGINPKKDITTLGRGGSDLTAVALATALRSGLCEIYTDVDGVYTADPRICPDARRIDKISYNEMLEFAGSGTQVMQSRAIEVAKKFNVVIEVKSSFNNRPGTIICGEVKPMEDVLVTGVSYDKNQAKLSIQDLPDVPGIAALVFGKLAESNLNVDMIVQSSARDGYNDISFTVSKSDLRRALPILKKLCKKLKAEGVIYDDGVSKVSIVGVGMKSHPGVAGKMFNLFAENKINIEMISTSEIKISCIVKQKYAAKAVKVLHDGFNLGRKTG